MKRFTIIFTLTLIYLFVAPRYSWAKNEDPWWGIQSIDTMKYSRDLAREMVNVDSFAGTIDKQVSIISELGATHVAVGTPYDAEFVPYLRKWVEAARKYGLKVWFRGNFSGWEGWFSYKTISKDERMSLLSEFIRQNQDIFEDGDIFSSCPECENGAIGDPRKTRRVDEFRNLLVNEYALTKNLFSSIGKNVASNYFSMNGDVAKLVMDPATTNKLDGIIVVDHYVSTPSKLAEDIKYFAEYSQGKVVLGEFGVSIPDIHGELTEDERAAWLEEALSLLVSEPNLIGINYWVLAGGSTSLTGGDGELRQKAEILRNYYIPRKIVLRVRNEFGQNLKDVKVSVGGRDFYAHHDGSVKLLYHSDMEKVSVHSDGYKSSTYTIVEKKGKENITLESERTNMLIMLWRFIRNIFI